MTMLVERSPRGQRNGAEITEGLTRLALNSGNIARTSEETGIPESTLRDWRDKHHPEAYQRIVSEQVPAIYARIAEKCEGLALDQAEAEAEILAHLRNQIEDLKPDQAATALRNVAVSKAVNVDKASLVRGRPSEIRMELGVEDLVQAMNREFGRVLPALKVTNEADSDAMGDTADTEEAAPRDVDVRP